MDFSCIYLIRSIKSGRIYVGSAKNLRKRWSIHLHYLRHGKHHSPIMQRVFTKHGEGNLRLSVLELVADLSNLVTREQFWIDRLRAASGAHGMNISPTAGSTLGKPTTPATRKRIGDANRGRKYTGEALARKQAASRHPNQIAMLKAIVRPDELRRKVSLSKGGSGVVVTPDLADEMIALYETGHHSIPEIAKRFLISYNSARTTIRGIGCKAVAGKSATTPSVEEIRRRTACKLYTTPIDIMLEIIRRVTAGERQSDLADEFNLSRPKISRIINIYARRLTASQ